MDVDWACRVARQVRRRRGVSLRHITASPSAPSRGRAYVNSNPWVCALALALGSDRERQRLLIVACLRNNTRILTGTSDWSFTVNTERRCALCIDHQIERRPTPETGHARWGRGYDAGGRLFPVCSVPWRDLCGCPGRRREFPGRALQQALRQAARSRSCVSRSGRDISRRSARRHGGELRGTRVSVLQRHLVRAPRSCLHCRDAARRTRRSGVTFVCDSVRKWRAVLPLCERCLLPFAAGSWWLPGCKRSCRYRAGRRQIRAGRRRGERTRGPDWCLDADYSSVAECVCVGGCCGHRRLCSCGGGELR
jgi:hypothetical protein